MARYVFREGAEIAFLGLLSTLIASILAVTDSSVREFGFAGVVFGAAGLALIFKAIDIMSGTFLDEEGNLTADRGLYASLLLSAVGSGLLIVISIVSLLR
jgi:hypothetical protein